LLNIQLLNAQNRISVKGVVQDASGELVIGASILEKGTTNGTITDLDGNFSLNVSSNATLVVSYIGYLTQEIPVANKTSFQIKLKDDTQTLDEVVVVGFGVQKKVNLTGSVGTATSKDIESRPVQNVAMALQGVIPGLNISNSDSSNGGELNGSKSIDIRGTGTIGDGSTAKVLILIDGVEGDFNNLNPQDIDNISVLKDAAASSIYGSRAPFGVVLITTKKGSEGRAKINYNMNFQANTPIRMPKMADSWEYVNAFRDAFLGGGTSNTYNNESFLQKVKDYRDGKLDPNDVVWSADGTGAQSSGKWNYDWTNGNVDWLKEYYKDWSHSQEHNASISGGTKDLSYYISGNFLTKDGFMRHGTDTYDRYTLTGKVSAKVTNWLDVNYSYRFVRTDYSRPTIMNDGFYSNIMRRARSFRPVNDPNGYYFSDINYVNSLENGGRHKEQNDFNTNSISLKFEPIKNWTITTEFNMKTSTYWTHWDQNVQYGHYSGVKGSYTAEDTYTTALTGADKSKVSEKSEKQTYLNPNIYTNYNFTLYDKHNIGVMLGFQSEDNKQRYVDAGQYNMTVESLPVLDLTTGETDFTILGQYNTWRTAGFFGRVNYDYNGKYLFEGNLRYDGSSRYREGSRWVTSPSFSLGWNLAREAFMEDINWMDMLKVRFSYGQLANQNTTNWYPTYSTMDIKGGNTYWLESGSKTTSAYMPTLISSTLTWEKIKTTNIGLDWALFNSRLTGSFDYYVRKTDGMVGPAYDLPATLGADAPKTNNTSLRTSGWELQIGWKDRIRDFTYGASLNISDSRTKITKYYNSTDKLDTYVEGLYTGNIWGYTTIGIAQTDAEMEAHLATLPDGGQNALGSNWAAGDIMYADLNGDGKISNGSNTLNDMGDLKRIGDTTPRYRMGINLNAQWKGIDVSMFWQGVLKKDWAPGTGDPLFWGCTSGGEYWSMVTKDHLDYWRAGDSDSNLGANTGAYYPRLLFSNKNIQKQTKYVQSAAYMRLKNLQIGYTLPENLTSKIGLHNVRFYVSGENLLTITSLPDLIDPETCGIGEQGGVVYPLSTTYSFGLSVNF